MPEGVPVVSLMLETRKPRPWCFEISVHLSASRNLRRALSVSLLAYGIGDRLQLQYGMMLL